MVGNLIFTAGEIPLDPRTGIMPESIEEQAHLALKNLAGVIEAAGSRMDSVVSVTLYLSDMGDFAKVNTIYEGYFEMPFPARTCVSVSSLPKGAKIEISAIAVKISHQ